MTLPSLTYLTTDSLAEGVGASQVLAYVRELSHRGVDVDLHTFEKQQPEGELRQQLSGMGVHWTAHPFGPLGPRGGLYRVLRGAAAVRGRPLVHARSDLAAASALLGKPRTWVWDVRSLWADQRIALHQLRADGPEHRVLRAVERGAARGSSAVVTLTRAVLPVLDARYGGEVSPKATVIPTCVDLKRFPTVDMPARYPLRLLLAGTLNSYYDVPLMVRLVRHLQRRRDVELSVLTPSTSAWKPDLDAVGARFDSASPAEMPAHVARCHVGLSVCRSDAGVSLVAAMPTKVAEFLAVGRPVVVNPGLGDADQLVAEYGAGVVLADPTDVGLERACDELDELLTDPGTPERCRRLAEEHFDLGRAAERLIDIYRDVTARGPAARS